MFRLLKLRELNQNPRGALGQETSHSLKNLCSVDGVARVFRHYQQELKEAFFRSSIELKSLASESEDLVRGGKRLQIVERILSRASSFYHYDESLSNLFA